MRWEQLATLACLAAVAPIAAAPATVLRVPSEYPTIQAGIDVAVNGDTVLVADGTYAGDGNRDIDFGGKSIVVMSENGPEVTIIDCEGGELDHHRGFRFHSGEDSSAVVEGFTIMNGWTSNGGAIVCLNSSSPTIRGNAVTGNRATGATGRGGAINCKSSSSPTIRDNTISGNTADLEGGGISCRDGSYPRIVGNLIELNNTNGDGGGVSCDNADAVVQGNTVTGNAANGNGGGAYCVNSSPGIVDNIFAENEADSGGALYFGASFSTVQGNTLVDNDAVWGGGIWCRTSALRIVENLISGNHVTHAAGIYCRDCSSDLHIEANTVTANVTGISGAGIYCDYSSPTIVDNTITENWGPSHNGGGIFCYYSDPTIESNTIYHNNANWGGGIWCDYSSPEIRDNSITWNAGGGIACWNECSPDIVGNDILENGGFMSIGGGGIFCHNNSPAYIAGNKISRNRGWRGGLSCEDSSPTIVENEIIGNSRVGVSCLNSSPMIVGNEIRYNYRGISCVNSSPMIVGNSIDANRAVPYLEPFHAGGIYCCSSSSPTIVSNTITRNSTTWGNGGGIYLDGSSLTIWGNTILGNWADHGGGIYFSNSSAEMTNCILWWNSPDAIAVQGGAPVVTYCDVQGSWPGVGNVDLSPQFVLPEREDFRLLWGSPCIDAGHPDSLDPDSTRSDMGAHYFNQDDYLTLYLTPHTRELAPGAPLAVTYTVINRWPQPEPFWVETEAILPNGNPFSAFGPDNYTMPADFTVQRHLMHDVPLGAPLGQYEYNSDIWMPPVMLYDEDGFSFEIAPMCDYLVWNPSSGSSGDIMDALEAAGRTVEGVYGCFTDYYLPNYKGLFVCLGISSQLYQIMEGSLEAARIEEYIAAGGNVYMEGGSVWFSGPLWGGHDFGPSFGIDAVDGGSLDLYNVSGVANTLMPGIAELISPYYGGQTTFDHIEPIPPAELIFENSDNLDPIGVGYATPAGGHTIGISFEIGGTDDTTFVMPAVAEFVAFFEG